MASVLFIYPPIRLGKRVALSAYSPPLGILYLATILKNNGHNVHVIDAEAEALSIDNLVNRVKSIAPDVIGLTCLTSTLESSKTIVKKIKKAVDPYVVVGGPHISVAAEASLKQLEVDACVIGEAESIINEIVEKRPRGVVHGEEIQEIDTIPFPDQGLIKHLKYGTFYGLSFGKKMTGILTTRGCKYGCTYCNRPKKLSFRARSPRNIVEELKELDRMGFDSIWLADDNFTNKPENVIKLTKLIKHENLDIRFFAQARVDVPSEALYKAMWEMGVVGLSFGVESLKPEVIKWYRKNHHPEKWPKYVRKTLELCDKYNIGFLGSLIFGAPMETLEDMMYSIEFLHENGADIINGNILLYLIGSPIWRKAVRNGKISPDQFMVSAPEIGTTPYSMEELSELCDYCTNLSKHYGWRRILPKVLKRLDLGFIISALKQFFSNYLKVRKIRREVYKYGYGKKE